MYRVPLPTPPSSPSSRLLRRAALIILPIGDFGLARFHRPPRHPRLVLKLNTTQNQGWAWPKLPQPRGAAICLYLCLLPAILDGRFSPPFVSFLLGTIWLPLISALSTFACGVLLPRFTRRVYACVCEVVESAYMRFLVLLGAMGLLDAEQVLWIPWLMDLTMVAWMIEAFRWFVDEVATWVAR